MEIATVWMFVIYCTSNCPSYFDKKVTNNYFNSSSLDGCIEQAKNLIRIKGLTGNWEIECKPYQREIKIRPAEGN